MADPLLLAIGRGPPNFPIEPLKLKKGPWIVNPMHLYRSTTRYRHYKIMSHPCEELCYIKFEKEKIINPSIFSLIIFLNFPLGIIQERIKDFPGYQSQRGESAYYSTKFSHKLHENGENWAEVGRGD